MKFLFKRVEFEWGLITLVAALLTTFLLVSCAPTHPSFSLASQSPAAAPTQPGQDDANRALKSESISALAGDWVCDDSDPCSVTKISVLADGSAKADGHPASISVEAKGENSIHLTLSIPAHNGISATTLSGDISTSSEIDVLTLNQSLYARAAD